MELKIENFKCFEKLELELRPLTLLTGMNGVGKSVVMNALVSMKRMDSLKRNNIFEDELKQIDFKDPSKDFRLSLDDFELVGDCRTHWLKEKSENAVNPFNLRPFVYHSSELHFCNPGLFEVETWVAIEEEEDILKQIDGLLLVEEGVKNFTVPRKGFYIFIHPENDLHPKKQSELGVKLARLAKNNTVVVETHSEHVLNGIRKEVVKTGSTNDFIAHYIVDSPIGILEEGITMDKKGNLSDFPVDFFDQVRQDLWETIETTSKLAETANGGRNKQGR